jgi:hypothetical protein
MIEEFVQRFYHHLEEQSIDDAVVLVLQEAEAANLDDDQITDVLDELVTARNKGPRERLLMLARAGYSTRK